MGLEEIMEKIVILPDVHLTDKVPEEYKVVKRFIKKYKPNEVILLGDFMDVASLSAWDMDKKRLMEGRRYKKEVCTAQKELDFLQKYSDKVTYLDGNHEYRVDRYVDKHPEVEGLLETKNVLNLKDRGVKWRKLNDPYKKGSFYFIHGAYTNKYHAMKHLDMYGQSMVYGHGHNLQTAQTNTKLGDQHIAYGLPCLSSTNPKWMGGNPTRWVNGFGIMEMSEKEGVCNLYPVIMQDGKFVYNGKVYK